MTKVDQFESVFRSASKEVYSHSSVDVERVLVVTDLEADEAEAFGTTVQSLLGDAGADADWIAVGPDRYENVGDLLSIVEGEKPDLVCTYRNLKSSAWRWPYSLGEYVDVLCQVAPFPVLVLPHPAAKRAREHALRNTDVVMAITDHMTGDATLVDVAAHFTQPGGLLLLTHIESGAAFDRYMDAISKIPSIETESAHEAIEERLLKEPREYVETCIAALADARDDLRTQSIVAMGHKLTEYRRFIDEHEIDLLVFHTKVEGQLAMNGLAYPLAVELREIPLLML
jgi:hypothetical protein